MRDLLATIFFPLALITSSVSTSTTAKAVEASTCLNQLREIIGSPRLSKHYVHPDDSHVKMAPEFLKATEEIYNLLPKEMKRPTHMDLELIGKQGRESISNCATGSIVCEMTMSDAAFLRSGSTAIEKGLGVHAHELGHLISYENYHYKNLPMNDYLINHNHPFFKADLLATLKADDEAGKAKLAFEAAMNAKNQLLANLNFQIWETAQSNFQKIKIKLLRKRQFWRAYDEVFADLVAVAWTKDPKIISRATQDVLGRINVARDFSVEHPLSTWVSTDEHTDLSPTRSHLWFHYLQKDPNTASRLIGATHRALLHEIDATLADPSLYELSLASKNQRFMDEIDRQMAL